MKNVLVFGTFDGLHDGHKYFFEQSSTKGDALYVLVARDATVQKVKGKLPMRGELQRLKEVDHQPIVAESFLGNPDNHFSFLSKIVPDIICLGYDQKFMVEELRKEIKDKGLKIEVIVLDSFEPDKYKSSILNNKEE